MYMMVVRRVVTHLSTCEHLPHQQIRTHIRDAHQQPLALLWIPIQPPFRLLKGLAPAPFYHVRHERPRGTTEPDERHPSIQSSARELDSFKEVSQFFLHIHVGAQTGEVGGVDEGFREDGTALGFHEDRHAHCLWHHEDVGEDDGCVQQGVSVDRLEGEGRGDGWGLAAFEEGMVGAHREELCTCQRGKHVYTGRRDETCQGGIAQPGA